MEDNAQLLDIWRQRYPQKFASEKAIFGNINRGDSIFISSACAEPQHLVRAIIRYVKDNPKAFFDAEVLHIRTLGWPLIPRRNSSRISVMIPFSSGTTPARPSIRGWPTIRLSISPRCPVSSGADPKGSISP